MIWLWLGVGLWCAVHLMPSVARGIRTSLIDSLGETKYKIGFALSIVLSIVLMVIGWRATSPVGIYTPPDWGRHVALLFILVAFYLMSIGDFSSNVKRHIRHPQLTGMAVWATGHLIANGDSRSLLLFGGIGIWSVVEIVMISRRDRTWVRPSHVPLKKELRPVLAAAVIYAVIFLVHPYVIGVSPLG